MDHISKTRTSSNVNPIDTHGRVYKGFYIWTSKAPAVKENPDLCFARCIVLPGSTHTVFRCRQVEPHCPQKIEFDVPAKFAYNVNTNIDPMFFPDVGMIPHTNDAAALDFLKQRFLNEQIYTEARPLLVAINPFKDLKNATDEVIHKYRTAEDLDKLPPHVFSVARSTLENLHTIKKSKTIIVSGESGAGKTEAVKQVMRYLAAGRSGLTDTRIQTAVLAANPVLEAFGNAKTIRNNNSSRFGRFIQLQIRPEGGIQYGNVRCFLLEKSRIVTQEKDERSYHIFYYFLKAATSAEKQKYKLLELKDYAFLNPHTHYVDEMDDVEEWHHVQTSLDSMGITTEQKDSIFSIISGVLSLGNVKVSSELRDGVPDAACFDEKNKQLLRDACSTLFLDAGLVEEGLTCKVSKAGSEEVRGCWSQKEASVLKDSLAKGIYENLFHWIIDQLNALIKPDEEFQQFLALLDIFGFEVFNNNSLEQLLINITNEMLQNNFIDAVFDRETKLYRSEEISAVDLTWTNNKDVIELLTGPSSSIMTIFEDQCLAPGGTDEKFVLTAYKALKNHPKLLKAKISSNTNFVIVHTIGQIQYNCKNFIFKNKDVLRPELVAVVKQSKNPVASACFENVHVMKGRLAKGQLIGSQFLKQLDSLMKIINTTESHFIRCVKPNETKSPMKFVSSRVMVQLHSLSILEALQLRNLGFAYRRPFEEFLFQYNFVNLAIASDKKMTPKENTEALLKFAKIDPSQWRIGKTMVFMKSSATKEMGNRQREAFAAWVPVIECIEALLLCNKYKQNQMEIMQVLTRIQAKCRQKLTIAMSDAGIPASVKAAA